MRFAPMLMHASFERCAHVSKVALSAVVLVRAYQLSRKNGS